MAFDGRVRSAYGDWKYCLARKSGYNNPLIRYCFTDTATPTTYDDAGFSFATSTTSRILKKRALLGSIMIASISFVNKLSFW